MPAFHNTPSIKAFYVARLQEHHRLDQIVQGTGFDPETFRGCNVGCILHAYEHSRYPDELGLPEWYAHLCDKIFEGLPRDKAPAFAMASLTAIAAGVDIEPVRWQLAILRHQKQIDALKDNTEPYAIKCVEAIQQVIAYCESMLKGNGTVEQAESARSAARSVEWSAESAESVAWSAARSAALSAGSAAWSVAESVAAWSAALSAESVAWSARSDYYIWEAETLIALLKECKS